jgi:hypothetical protein
VGGGGYRQCACACSPCCYICVAAQFSPRAKHARTPGRPHHALAAPDTGESPPAPGPPMQFGPGIEIIGVPSFYCS